MPRGARHAGALATYRAKRRFHETPEPRGRNATGGGHLYTIQKHAARRLHYDLRLELDGVLKSWAVTRGPSLDPSAKRLAVRTEDHPLDYATFEGRIPEGNYGAGTVLLWDRGSWEPIGDPHAGLEAGKLVFQLHGERLKGRWALVRFKRQESERRENWLLIKEKDAFAQRDGEITAEDVTSVASGRELRAIAAAPEAVWTGDEDSGEGPKAKPARRPARRRAAASPLPAFVEPALATLVDDVPHGDGWLFEMKFDGYRTIAAASGGRVRLHTRNGLDWTGRYPAVARTLAGLDLDGVLLDGEIVVLDDKGRSDFGALQRSLKGEGGVLSYFVFDLLADSGRSLRTKPLAERKERLKALLAGIGREGPVFYTDHIPDDGAAMLRALCAAGIEGVVAKRADAPYRSGRGRSWVKVKCGRSQEFVIVGWAESTRDRPFSSILLGLHEGGRLRYAGRAGSGFSEDALAALAGQFRGLARKTPPVDGALPREARRNARWIEPRLVANIEFAEFTRDGLVRQGRFLGLREDKPAKAVAREEPLPVDEAENASKGDAAATVAGVRLTHPDRVLYPEQGITKRDLARHLEAVAERMLPHVRDRLVSLVRCPEGTAGECFFQRHGGSGAPGEWRKLAVRQKRGGTADYLYIPDAKGLVAAAQMGVLEFHIWGSRIDDIERPDRIVFDLDPDPSVDFETVKGAARRMRDALAALDIESFALLTGGKGIHVVAPIVRQHPWPVVKAFAGALARRFADDAPERYVATMSKAERTGRIFIDHFRNERGSTAIAPYSPRARRGAPVAWPVGWTELDRIAAAGEVTLAAVPARLKKADPWKGYAGVRQRLKAAALRALDVEA